LFSWRRSERSPVQDDADGPAFAPVIVDADTAGPRGTPIIEIVMGAATVRVGPGIDAATLAKVLRAVKAAT
jgi:hypothetical protein